MLYSFFIFLICNSIFFVYIAWDTDYIALSNKTIYLYLCDRHITRSKELLFHYFVNMAC